jgi:UDP-N-acetylmuramate dehydrogenase
MFTPMRGVPLAGRTSFKIGGVAREFFAPASIEELRRLLGWLHSRGATPFVLGGGANTLFPDGELSRPVVSTENLRGIRTEGNRIHAECGVRLNVLIQEAIRRGLGGLEGFVGIPGTAGGAVAMNAGGSGWSFGERVSALTLIPLDGGRLFRLAGRDVPWSYRSSNLKGAIVAQVELDLQPGSRERLKSSARDLMRQKALTQPLNHHSAGCIFRNPAGGSAGKWIDALGLKGLSRGGARVSERHANFIVNPTGEARAEDVLFLVEEVRSRVERTYGVRLETEIVVA